MINYRLEEIGVLYNSSILRKILKQTWFGDHHGFLTHYITTLKFCDPHSALLNFFNLHIALSTLEIFLNVSIHLRVRNTIPFTFSPHYLVCFLSCSSMILIILYIAPPLCNSSIIKLLCSFNIPSPCSFILLIVFHPMYPLPRDTKMLYTLSCSCFTTCIKSLFP